MRNTTTFPRHPRLGRRSFCLALTGAVASLALPGNRRVGAATLYPDVIGEVGRYTTRDEDTLLEVARRFNLGYTELVAANPGVDPWVPGEGVELVIPGAHVLPRAPRDGVVLNLADQRLYFFRPETGAVETVPIGVGRDAWNTPIGRTKVVRKKAGPAWYPPKSIRAEDPTLPAVVPPGPNNPLGTHAIYLGWQSYLIHGTHKPMGVGRRVSHGCVRMYPEDIVRYFEKIAVGTSVTVVDEPVKIARRAEALMLEIHPSQSQADDMEAGNRITPERPADFEYRILDAAGSDAQRLDWPLIWRALRERRGVPVAILKPEKATAGSKT